jgi:hypothetical protein
MRLAWGSFSHKTQGWLKAGGLVAAGLAALTFGVVMPRDAHQGIVVEKRLGLAAFSREESNSAALQERQKYRVTKSALQVAGDSLPRGVPRAAMLNSLTTGSSSLVGAVDEHKLIRNGALDLIVKSPTESAEQIRALAEGVGGFLVSSQTTGGPGAASASLVIRVPAGHFEEVRAGIRKLGVRVESESFEAQDVTREYVDQEARLRSLRAQETQYLAIMKRAVSVKETLEVSEKLSGVRGQIEQQQAEFNALSKQVETVAISMSLHTEADVSVFGLNWRPLYQLKMSAREGVLALSTYVAAMAAFLFYLPAILLWLATILAGVAIGWRLVKWARLAVFAHPETVDAKHEAS